MPTVVGQIPPAVEGVLAQPTYMLYATEWASLGLSKRNVSSLDIIPK